MSKKKSQIMRAELKAWKQRNAERIKMAAWKKRNAKPAQRAAWQKRIVEREKQWLEKIKRAEKAEK